jgi:hypothetical protein
MTNQLSHANLFSDLSNVTLRRVFKTDQGWTIEADGQDFAICPGPDLSTVRQRSPKAVVGCHNFQATAITAN